MLWYHEIVNKVSICLSAEPFISLHLFPSGFFPLFFFSFFPPSLSFFCFVSWTYSHSLGCLINFPLSQRKKQACGLETLQHSLIVLDLKRLAGGLQCTDMERLDLLLN